MREELVNIIAETIYSHFRDSKIIINDKEFFNLSDREKEFYRTIAHDVMCDFDNYYDDELDKESEEILYDDDPYNKVEIEDEWEL